MSEFVGRMRVRRVVLIVGLVFAALPVGSAVAQTPSVFAGYADGIRTDPSSHPSPWQGAAGVDFVGCNYFTPALCPKDRNGVAVYDAGALMLANDTNQAMTVTNASVTIGTCTFEPWPGVNVIVTPGQKLILTQTGGPTPCGLRVVGLDGFDASESNTAPTPCTNDGLIPEFQVTVNGTTLTYRDTAQILNTGGIDPGECNGNTETHAWEPLSPGVVLAAPPSTPPSTTPTPRRGISPILSAFQAFPGRLSLAGRLVGGRCVKPTRKNDKHKHCTRPVALELRYALNTAAAVSFTLTRQEPGRMVHGRCLAVTRKNRMHALCTRPTTLPGALIHASTAGSNTFTFPGRIGGTTLGPGTYQLTATPLASGSNGTPRTITVKLVR